MPDRILVVDDEEKTRKYLGRYMERKGYEVLSAENGEKALELIKNEKVHAVVLDVLMPGMDGISVLEQVKKINPDIPVIILTGCASAELGMKGMKAGAFDFMGKPVNPAELLNLVASALEYGKYLKKGIGSVDMPELE